MPIVKTAYGFRQAKSPFVTLATLMIDLRFAQIQLAFDTATRLVLELSLAKQIVDVVALRCDQQQFKLVVQVAQRSMGVFVVAAVVDLLQPVLMMRTRAAQ